MACGEVMRLVQAAADQSMAVPGFEQHLYRCPGCHDTERRLVFVHPDDPAPRRIEPLREAELLDVTLQPAAPAPGEQDAPPVALATPENPALATPENSAQAIPEDVIPEDVIPEDVIPEDVAPPAAAAVPAEHEAAPNAWQKHRSRWSALRERLGLRMASEASTRKE
jgi:hypothetical protein